MMVQSKWLQFQREQIRKKLRLKSDDDEKTKCDFFQSPPPSQKQPQPIKSGVDYISDLPSSLLASILSFLSIKEAARTSVLSKHWRHLWLSLPFFTIDESICFSFQTSYWTTIIRHILRQHYRANLCPIPCLNILLPLGGMNLTERFILWGILVARRGTRRLKLCDTLTSSITTPFVVPLQFFQCFALEDFFIQGCTIKDLPNPMTWISPILRTLELVDVFISDIDFQILMTSSSTSLQQLFLKNLLGLGNLVLPPVPKLSELKVFVQTPLRKISLAGARHLSVFALDLRCLQKGTYLVDILMELNNVYHLYLQFPQDSPQDQGDMSMRRVRLPQCLPSDQLLLVNLRELEMKMSLADENLFQILFPLLCNSPNLEALIIEDDELGIARNEIIDIIYWEKQHVPRCLKNTLLSVQLRNVNLNCQSVVGFANFILMNSCILKTMKINSETWSL